MKLHIALEGGNCRTRHSRGLVVRRMEASADEGEWSEISLYREYTIAMLRRYSRLASDIGKIPSVMGKEFLKARVSFTRVNSFENDANYIVDMERCLAKVDAGSRWLIDKIVLEEYLLDEVAEVLGMSPRQMVRRYALAVDAVSEKLLDADLLLRLDALRRGRTVRSILNESAGGVLGEHAVQDSAQKKPVQRVRWTKVERRIACRNKCCEEANKTTSRQCAVCEVR